LIYIAHPYFRTSGANKKKTVFSDFIFYHQHFGLGLHAWPPAPHFQGTMDHHTYAKSGSKKCRLQQQHTCSMAKTHAVSFFPLVFCAFGNCKLHFFRDRRWETRLGGATDCRGWAILPIFTETRGAMEVSFLVIHEEHSGKSKTVDKIQLGLANKLGSTFKNCHI